MWAELRSNFAAVQCGRNFAGILLQSSVGGTSQGICCSLVWAELCMNFVAVLCGRNFARILLQSSVGGTSQGFCKHFPSIGCGNLCIASTYQFSLSRGGQWMEYRCRLGSLGNSSTASKSSDFRRDGRTELYDFFLGDR